MDYGVRVTIVTNNIMLYSEFISTNEINISSLQGMLLGVLLLIMCIFLLGGMGLSLSTSGYELLHFNHKDDVSNIHWQIGKEKNYKCMTARMLSVSKQLLVQTVTHMYYLSILSSRQSSRGEQCRVYVITT